MESELIQSLIIACVVGGASGAIGAFVILRRMALVGDALSHVALPGIAIAIAYRIDPFWGVVVSLVLAALVIFWLEGRTKLSGETLVGILFTASLAVGILAIPDSEILESLFGAFPQFSTYVILAVVIVAIAAIILVFWYTKKFSFRIISPELAMVHGVSRRYDLIFLLIFAITVALGIKLVGTLLMGALTIIPASVAKNISIRTKSYVSLSMALGILISAGGVLTADYFVMLPGPTIILFGISLFLLSLLYPKSK